MQKSNQKKKIPLAIKIIGSILLSLILVFAGFALYADYKCNQYNIKVEKRDESWVNQFKDISIVTGTPAMVTNYGTEGGSCIKPSGTSSVDAMIMTDKSVGVIEKDITQNLANKNFVLKEGGTVLTSSDPATRGESFTTWDTISFVYLGPKTDPQFISETEYKQNYDHIEVSLQLENFQQCTATEGCALTETKSMKTYNTVTQPSFVELTDVVKEQKIQHVVIRYFYDTEG